MMSSARRMRCFGAPDRDSSWPSPGNRQYSTSRAEQAQRHEQRVGLLDVAAQVLLAVEDEHRAR